MRFFGWHLDFIGFSASFACALHCIALPLLLSFGFLGGAAWLENEFVEFLLIIGSIFIASYSIGRSYYKVHRRLLPVYWVGVGILLLLSSLLISSEIKHLLTALGGFTIAYGHYANWKFLRCKVK